MVDAKLIRRQRTCPYLEFITDSINDSEITSNTVLASFSSPKKTCSSSCSGSQDNPKDNPKSYFRKKKIHCRNPKQNIFQKQLYKNKEDNLFNKKINTTFNPVAVTSLNEHSTQQLVVNDFDIYLVSTPQANAEKNDVHVRCATHAPTTKAFLTEVPHKTGGWVSNFDTDDDMPTLGKVEAETALKFYYDDVSSDSSEYETDIEEAFPAKPHKPSDTTGACLYKKECFKAKIIPIRNLINQLQTDKIEMRYAGLGVKGSIALSKALKINQNVRKVDLSENDMKVDGGEAFIDMLHDNCIITTAILSDNHLSPEIGVKIAEMLRVNTTLQTIILKGNGFTDRVAKAFAEILKINNTLITLDLSYNEFSEQGGLYIGAGLGSNRCLKILNLQWNSIRGKGAVSIAAAIKTNQNLTNLNMSWNGISLIGCLAFGTYLKRNKTLRVLDISNNRIGTYGTRKIAPALAVHPSLKILKIGLNSIGDEGAMNILNAVKKNKSLKLVDLQDVTISESTNKIVTDLQQTRDIKIITGGLGGFTKGTPPPSGMDVLVQFMQDNRLRLTDIFSQWDKDKSADISKKEMKHGAKETGLDMDMHQLRNLVEQLDENLDGSIDFREIVAGKRNVVFERRFQKKVAIRTEEREKQSIQLPNICDL